MSSLRSVFVGFAVLERDEHRHGFALDFVGPAHGGGFGHARMADQGAFDFDRAQPVAGHVQHVVDPAHDPVVAVVVAAGVVAGQVVVRHLGPVLLAIPLVVAPNAAQHAGQGLVITSQPPCPAGTGLPLPIDDRRHDAGQRLGATAGLGGESRPAAGSS